MNFINLYLLIEKGQYREYLRYIDQDQSISQVEKNYLQACYYIKINDRDKYQELVTSQKDLTNEISDLEQLAILIKGLSFLIFEGEEHQFNNIVEKIDPFFNNENSFDTSVLKLAQADYHHYYAIYYMMRGDYQKSEVWFEKAIKLDENIGIPIRIAKVMNNYSLLKADEGEIVKAQSINFEVKKMWEKTQSTHNLGQLYGNISELYEIRGMHDSALYYARQSEKILLELGSNFEKMMIQGSIFRILRKYQSIANEEIHALFDNLKFILNDDPTLLNNQLTSRILVELVIYATSSARDTIDELFELFDQLLTNTQNAPYVKYRYDLSQGIYLARSGRFKDKHHAQQILDKFTLLNDVDFFVQSSATRYIIDLLLFEYQSVREKSIIEELKKYRDNLNTWVVNHNSLKLELDYLLISIQIACYEDDIGKMFELFHLAIVIAIENGLKFYYNVLNMYYHQLKQKLDQPIKISNWDIFESLTELPNVELEEEEIITEDIILFDRFNNIYSLAGKDTSEYNLVLDKIIKIPNNYYLNSSSSGEILLKKIDAFPWLGIVFRNEIKRAVTILDFISNAINSTMIYQGKEKTSEAILKSEEVRLIVDDVLHRQEFSDFTPPRSEFTKLQDYKLLLHPMRLAIMDVLKRTFSMPRKDLEKVIEGNRGTFASHLTKLIENELLHSDTQFVNEEPLMIINITNKGLSYYSEFKSIIQHV